MSNLVFPSCHCFAGPDADENQGRMSHSCVHLAERLSATLGAMNVCPEAAPYYMATIANMVICMASDNTLPGQTEATPEQVAQYCDSVRRHTETLEQVLHSLRDRAILIVSGGPSGTIN